MQSRNTIAEGKKLPSRRPLGELEQLVLLAVLRLGEDQAYGPAIRKTLKERAGRRVGPGTLYPTLDRLEQKGFLTSSLGEPTPEPGGRAKRYFAVTPRGLEEVRRAWEEMLGLAADLDHLLDPGAAE